MRANVGVSVLATLVLAMLPSAALAGYCGAARYNGCVPCSYQQDCHTVMKTVRCTEYEQKEITCYHTVIDEICEAKVISVPRCRQFPTL